MVDLDHLGCVLSPLARKAGAAASRRHFRNKGNRLEVHLSEEELAIIVASAVEAVLKSAQEMGQLLRAQAASGVPS